MAGTAYGDGDYQPDNYQDDLNTDDDATDPIITEEGDDPTEDLGIDPEEFERELLKQDDEDGAQDIEDQDNDPEGRGY